MTNQEAKFILHAYRPSGADADDATITAALAQAKQDPSLAKWFEAQQAFDRAMCTKLRMIAPPAGLREAILAGAKVSHRPVTADPAWWRSPRLMALAASLALLLAVGLAFWPKSAEAHEGLMELAVNDTLYGSHHEAGHEQSKEFQALLSSTTNRFSTGMPLRFEQLRQRGCRTISYEGRNIFEVCFKRDGKWFHCYVARVQDFPSIAAKLPPAFRDQSGVAAGAWADGEHIFVVASKAGRKAIQKLI